LQPHRQPTTFKSMTIEPAPSIYTIAIRRHVRAMLKSKLVALEVAGEHAATLAPATFVELAQNFVAFSQLAEPLLSNTFPDQHPKTHTGKALLRQLRELGFACDRQRALPAIVGDSRLQCQILVILQSLLQNLQPRQKPIAAIIRSRGDRLVVTLSFALFLPASLPRLCNSRDSGRVMAQHLDTNWLQVYAWLTSAQREHIIVHTARAGASTISLSFEQALQLSLVLDRP